MRAAALAPLLLAARHGRILLIAGLVCGLALPALAEALRPRLPEMIAALMFLAALRIGPHQALGALHDLPALVGRVLIYQLAVPMGLIAGFWLAGLIGTPAALALVLMTAAPPVSGSPNLVALAGGDPAPALRLLVAGTVLLPLTSLPVLAALGGLGTPDAVLAAVLRLLSVIALAGGVAFLLRGMAIRRPAPEMLTALDGLSAVIMAVVVIGLMAKAGPTLLNSPASFAGWLALACAGNFGLQMLAARLASAAQADRRIALSIPAGNRNIALFLVALPTEVTDGLLVFIGCYQVPMYLTPLLLRFLLRA